MNKILIFGTGSFADNMLINCRKELDGFEVLAFIDNDVVKQGKEFNGKKIISVNDIHNYDYDTIAVCSTYFEEIKNQLINLGINKKKISHIETEWDFLVQRVRKRYKEYYKSGEVCNKDEIGELLDYFEKNYRYPKHFQNIYNYDYISKYYDNNYEVYQDEFGMKYVLYDGKKMYFPKEKKWTDSFIKWYFATILSEQDINSPHRYNIEEINEGAVVLDVGTAEGIFALSVIDKVSKIYIFEMDSNWLEALNNTFSLYRDKVVIVNKRIGLNADCTKLDDVVKEEKVDYIKLDIDGYEADALESGKRLLNSSNLKVSACSYHNLGDEEKIERVMKKYDLDVSFSKGYMLTFDKWGNYDYYFSFKKGMVYGEK